MPFTAVQLADPFWAPRIETNRQVSIPFAFQQCELSGRMDNFVRAAAALRGRHAHEQATARLSVRRHRRVQGDRGRGLRAERAPGSEARGVRGRPRREDRRRAGARRLPLHHALDRSRRTRTRGRARSAGSSRRWTATSSTTSATSTRPRSPTTRPPASDRCSTWRSRSADLLTRTFGPGKRAIWPGHQITEMGLVKLYRVTGEQKYLDLAKFLLDSRGPDGDEGAGRDYNQSHLPVVEQVAAVGHAVRATYMYSGMADVAALTGDASYLAASDAIWRNVVGKKLYVTGGIGATRRGEAFGGDYELPNMTAYNETCASIGNDYWNHRLFLLHGDAKYIDVMERTLYNGLALRRVARRQVVLLPQPARVQRTTRAQPVVRRRVLPLEHHALPGVGAGLRLRAAGTTRCS